MARPNCVFVPGGRLEQHDRRVELTLYLQECKPPGVVQEVFRAELRQSPISPPYFTSSLGYPVQAGWGIIDILHPCLGK